MNIHKLSLLLAVTLLVTVSSPISAQELQKEYFDRVKEK